MSPYRSIGSAVDKSQILKSTPCPPEACKHPHSDWLRIADVSVYTPDPSNPRLLAKTPWTSFCWQLDSLDLDRDRTSSSLASTRNSPLFCVLATFHSNISSSLSSPRQFSSSDHPLWLPSAPLRDCSQQRGQCSGLPSLAPMRPLSLLPARSPR